MSASPGRRTRRKFRKLLSDKAEVIPFTPEGDGALVYSRQSHYTDQSLSSPTQVGQSTRWCAAYDVPIVATVEDLHVSGDLDPFKRTGSRLVTTTEDGEIQTQDTEGLAVWLSDAPPRPWKTLIVAKLDRVSRNALDALRLLRWLRARGKRLVSVAEGIDTSNSMGEFLVTVIAAIAEMERTRMRERFADSKQSLKDAGRWAGESHVYGTMPVELPRGGGWVLGLDAYAVKILHKLSPMARSGKSLTEMCDWLTENKVVSARDRQLQLAAERRGEDPAEVELKGYAWHASALRAVLENPDLVEFGIFEPAEQAEIIARLEKRTQRRVRGSSQPYEFSGIFTCPECLEPLWRRTAHRSRKRRDGVVVEHTYNYWRCPSRQHGPSMHAEVIEPMAEQAFRTVFSLVPVRERVVLPPTDHANEIAKLQREYGKIMAGVARAKSQEDRRRITADGEKILADIDMLTSLPVDPGGVRWVTTDRTWEEELAELTPEDRRLRWLEMGFRFAVQQKDDGSIKAGWLLPEGWREEMPEIAERVPSGDIVDLTSVLDWPPAEPAPSEPSKPEHGKG